MGGLFSSKKKLLKKKPDATLTGGRIRRQRDTSVKKKKKSVKAETDERRSHARSKAVALENNALGGRGR